MIHYNAFAATQPALLRTPTRQLALLKRIFKARSWPIAALVTLGVALIISIIVGAAFLVLHLRDRALSEAERQLNGVLLPVSVHVAKELDSLSRIRINIASQLRLAVAGNATPRDEMFHGRDVHLLLKSSVGLLEDVRSLSLKLDNGRLLNSSDSELLAETSSERMAGLLPAGDEEVPISAPQRKADGTWVIFASWAIENLEKDLPAYLTIEIDLQKFNSFFEANAFDQSGALSLLTKDGILLTRRPRIEGMVGRAFSAATHLVASGDHGATRITSIMDGKERLIVARRVPGYPLITSAALDVDAALAGWQSQVASLLALTLISVLVIAVLFGAVVRRLTIAHKWSKQRLELEKLRLRSAIENVSFGLLMFDANEKLVVCNRQYLELYDLSADRIKPGCTVTELISCRTNNGTFIGDAAEYLGKLRDQLSAGSRAHSVITLPDGRMIRVINQPMSNGGWVAIHEDITVQRRASERVSYLAHHDSLTGLLNRATFNEYLSVAIENASQNGTGVAVLSLDLDGFKEVNDIYGHQAGDRILCDVAARMKRVLDETFLFRVGGDEFAVLVVDGPQPETASEIAKRLIDGLKEPFSLEGRGCSIGVTVGAAIYPRDGADAPVLLAHADAALYQAKTETRNAVRFFDSELDARLREGRELQNDLRMAIENGELFLNYQPLKSIATDEILGFEALARWRCPKRGLVPPSTFIPIAEESNLIIPLGEWVLREACREATTWKMPLKVAVNASPTQFRFSDLPKLVHEVLLETGLPASRLELEITETVMVDDFARAVSILRKLKSLGVRINMDDFGSGYSSLSYLHSFPFDKIKIDRAFVTEIESNRHSQAIVRAVVSLARSLGVPVIAEGVESKEQLDLLKELGCDELQGYLIGRPGEISTYAAYTGKDSLLAASA